MTSPSDVSEGVGEPASEDASSLEPVTPCRGYRLDLRRDTLTYRKLLAVGRVLAMPHRIQTRVKTAFSLLTSCELLFGHLETECERASRYSYRRPKRAIERTGRGDRGYEGVG